MGTEWGVVLVEVWLVAVLILVPEAIRLMVEFARIPVYLAQVSCSGGSGSEGQPMADRVEEGEEGITEVVEAKTIKAEVAVLVIAIRLVLSYQIFKISIVEMGM